MLEKKTETYHNPNMNTWKKPILVELGDAKDLINGIGGTGDPSKEPSDRTDPEFAPAQIT